MTTVTKELLLQQVGDFTYMWGQDFFIETPIGNFHWKDPQYEGDNTMTLYHGSYLDFCRTSNIPHGRDKGFHDIERYCGSEFTLVIPDEPVKKVGRPKVDNPKVKIYIRLDRDIIDHFKKDGPGWQTRVNQALLDHVRANT